jgi:hypothetical protein
LNLEGVYNDDDAESKEKATKGGEMNILVK